MPSHVASAAPPANMSYDAASGTVICRSKMRLGLKRNCQVMPRGETTRFGYPTNPVSETLSEYVRAAPRPAELVAQANK